MGTNRPLAPGFINRLDQQLLTNNPVVWSTRIHLVLYFGLSFTAFLVLICFIAPDDPRNDSRIHNWVVLLSIVSLLAFVFWMIYLLRFNVFKRFGRWKNMDTAKTFFLYLLIVLLIVLWPFIPPIIQSARANMTYSSDELTRDINSMNTKLCQLEKDSISTRFSSDTLILRDTMRSKGVVDKASTGVITPDIVSVDTVLTYVEDESNYQYVDSKILREKLANADSISFVNDSMYVVLTCPNYGFVESFSYGYPASKTLSSMDLYRQVLLKKESPDTGKLKAELALLFAKYSLRHDPNKLSTVYESYSINNEPGYFERIKDKYELYIINTSLSNIVEKKYRYDQDTTNFCWRALYYISLFLVLLVTIYRHTTRRIFFLSLLTAVVLTILTGIFLAMPGSNEGTFFTWIIVYFILFGILSATVVTSQHRNPVSGIALNLLVFITPFLPLVITGSYYAALRNKFYTSDSDWSVYAHLFENEGWHYFVSEIVGFSFLILLLASLYQAAYKKWFALPAQ